MIGFYAFIGAWIGFCLFCIGATLYNAVIADKEKQAKKKAAEAKVAAKKPRYVTRDHDDYDDRSNPYWATGTYDPDRYGQFVRSHSPEVREYIRDSYGDLDTYEANRPG